jgi:methyl-accepting chemotaxis protein
MNRRRNYFIKKKFQLKFVYSFLVLLTLEASLIIGLFSYISRNTITAGYSNSILTIEHTAKFFFTQFLFIVFIVGIGITLAAMVIFILLSHRIAGPLYRFEKTLNEISAGNLAKRINLRKNDQLNELQEALNSLLVSFDERLGRTKNNLSELKELLAKNDPGNLQKIYKVIELLEKEIEHFKVTSGSKD